MVCKLLMIILFLITAVQGSLESVVITFRHGARAAYYEYE